MKLTYNLHVPKQAELAIAIQTSCDRPFVYVIVSYSGDRLQRNLLKYAGERKLWYYLSLRCIAFVILGLSTILLFRFGIDRSKTASSVWLRLIAQGMVDTACAPARHSRHDLVRGFQMRLHTSVTLGRYAI